MRKEVGELDATPSKRTFLSIMVDYDLSLGLCELVDNAIDEWTRNGQSSKMSIKILLDADQQVIKVEDDAGGLKEKDLKYIVSPGQSGVVDATHTIGIFGVGTKRAVVALGQDVQISSRYKSGKTFQIKFDNEWLHDESWTLPYYEVSNIAPSSTAVDLSRLRSTLTTESEDEIREHLGSTYALFLKNNNLGITVNGKHVVPRTFENWAYPPGFHPRKYVGKLSTPEGIVDVKVVAGLANESSPSGGEYGVYFYCNNRLVVKALKSYDVGFTRGLIGAPHPKFSLTRVLVFLNGPPSTMPWNSSKSDVNAKNTVFRAMHAWLVRVVKDYASVSSAWVGSWDENVFKYDKGKIEEIPIESFPDVKKTFLPPIPKSRPRYGEIVTDKNAAVAKKKPWTKGLYEGVIAADMISKQKLEQRNRIALIVLDSTLEIAFKEYLVNDSGTHYSDTALLQLFSKRFQVIQEVKKTVTLKLETWKQISYYYNQRCKLVHEKATVGVSDTEIATFRKVVETVLKKIYGLRFSAE